MSCLEEILEILQFAADPDIVSSESKGVTDPIRRIFTALRQKLLNFGLELPEEMEILPSTSVAEKTDYRILYSDLLRIILKKFTIIQKEKKIENDWTEISTNTISNVFKIFEILTAISVLPSLEEGTTVPMEKRVNFVKVWKPFENEEIKKMELKKTTEIFFELIQINQGLKAQFISKFLSDIIASNEQLIYFSDFSMREQYEALMEKDIPKSIIFRELLILNGGFGLSGRKAVSPKWFSMAISTRLSSCLLEKNGLFHLFLAFDDLGGESFWQNSVILSTVAKMLSTKPRKIESYQKYANFIFEEFLTIMKTSKGGEKTSLLFGLTVEKLYSVDPNLVEIQLVDKLIRPWELLIERGIQNEINGNYGLWNPKLDASIVNLTEFDTRFVPELEVISKQPKKFASGYILEYVARILADFEMDFDNDILIDMLGIVKTIFEITNKRINELGGVSEIDDEVEETLEIESKSLGLAVGLVGAILTNATDDPGFKKELTKAGILMNEFIQKMNEMENCPMKEIYFSASENCRELIQLFRNDLKLFSDGFEGITEGTTSSKMYRRKKTKFEEWDQLLEEEEAAKGSALVEMARALRTKNLAVFRNEEDFEWVWTRANEHAVDPDSYVFLASINVLAELAYWKPEPFLQRLIDKFVSWINDEDLKDADLMLCCKIGEVLAKVFRQSGDFSTIYFDLFSNSLLLMTKAKDELMKSSGLSSLADLVTATRGRKYSTILNELLFMISQFLKTEDSNLVRRSSIHLLRCLISSSDESLLITFGDSLRDIYRLLRNLWLNDKDEAVRFHSELALIDLKKIMSKLISNLEI